MKIPNNLQTAFTIKSPLKISLSTLSPYSLFYNHFDNNIYHVFSIKPQTNYIISLYYGDNML